VSDDRVMMTYSLWDDEDSLNRYRHSDFFKQTWTTTKQLFAQKAEAVSLNEIKI
jgi:heme-degrading monooxygenase HmoA